MGLRARHRVDISASERTQVWLLALATVLHFFVRVWRANLTGPCQAARLSNFEDVREVIDVDGKSYQILRTQQRSHRRRISAQPQPAKLCMLP
eukprot:scaffold264_cov317-Pinguiococcus_pyrenoidosus.AAC.12